jgi:cAMP phosphodiesterase
MSLQVQLLPTSHGDDSHAQPLTSFLINDTIALDAGSLGFALSAERLASIEHVVLTHPHLDHTASLPLAVDAAYPFLKKPIQIHGTAPTLASVRRHLFNEEVWVDFTDFPLIGTNTPCLQWIPFEPRQAFDLKGLRFTPIPVNHKVPTVGFIVESATDAVLFTSDTWTTQEIWSVGSRVGNLRAVFIECSYPDEMADLAQQALHLTPKLMSVEIAKLNRKLSVYCVHLKPALWPAILRQLAMYADQGVEPVEIGRVYSWD